MESLCTGFRRTGVNQCLSPEQEFIMGNITGAADIKVTIDGNISVFSATEFLGYLSSSRINGLGKESIYISYGHEVPSGDDQEFDLTESGATYRDTKGDDWSMPTSGKLKLTVVRSEFGDSFQHAATLVDLTFGGQTPVVVLNGKYTIKYSALEK